MQEQDTTVSNVEYREVPGHPGYRVGSDGTVWSKLVKGTSTRLASEWRLMKQWLNSTDRLSVRLMRSKKPRTIMVHKVVLISFIGEAPEGFECCHCDGNHHNNRLENLRWDSRKGNMADRDAHGTTARGERSGNAKLTEEIVREIRSMHGSGGHSHRSLSRRFGVVKSVIASVVNRTTWRHVS